MTASSVALAQGISAIIQAFAAVVLVCVTIWYARLTNTLAARATQQVEMAERNALRIEERDLRRLSATVQRMTSTLDGFPTHDSDEPVDTRMRNAALWDQAAVTFVERIGLQYELLEESVAAGFVESTLWLLQRIREVRKTTPAQGYDYRRIEWLEWSERIENARGVLAHITAALSQR